MKDDLMRTEDLSKYLDVPKRTLEHWRTTGEGPKFMRLTARCVRYAKEDVAAWLRSVRFAHTAEADGAAAQ